MDDNAGQVLPDGSLSGDAVPSPGLPPAPTPAQGAGGIPIPLMAAAFVAAGVLGVMAGMRLARAITLQQPPTLVRVPCDECRKRREAEAVAATSPSEVERLVEMQTAVERAGADGL